MKFEFIPQHLDITESFWVFTIPEQSVSVPFLLVGNATDPLVTLDRSHLNFQLLLIGEHRGYTLHPQVWTVPGAEQSCCSSRLQQGSWKWKQAFVGRSSSSWYPSVQGRQACVRDMACAWGCFQEGLWE